MKKIRLSLCSILNVLLAASLIAVSVPSQAGDGPFADSRRVTTGKLLPPGIPVPGVSPVPVPVPVPTPPVVVERDRHPPPVVVERHRDYERYRHRDHDRDWGHDRRWHRDKWPHRHDRYYGRTYRTLPPDVFTLYLGGGTFFYYSGTFYRHSGDSYVVVEAPVGARVRILPDDCSPIISDDGVRYYECGDVYYESVDGEYVVIDRPPSHRWEAEIGEEVWITSDSLNLRAGPGLRNRVIGRLSRGEVVEVSGKEGDWYYIRLRGGSYGWILKEHARLYRHKLD